jgi:hypothetical protein
MKFILGSQDLPKGDIESESRAAVAGGYFFYRTAQHSSKCGYQNFRTKISVAAENYANYSFMMGALMII